MAEIYRNIKRKYLTDDDDADNLLPHQWAYSAQSRRLAVMETDGSTLRWFYDTLHIDSKIKNLPTGAITYGNDDDYLDYDDGFFMYDETNKALALNADSGTTGTTNGINRIGQFFINKKTAINTAIHIIAGADGTDNGNGILVSGNGTAAVDHEFYFFAALAPESTFCVMHHGADDEDYGKIFVGIGTGLPTSELHVVGYGEITESLLVGRDPLIDLEVATKGYVDNLIELTQVMGVKYYKNPVKTATTANITLEDNQTIDGVAVVNPDRVLVKDQTNPEENGIYVVTNTGAWTRATDFDDDPEVLNGIYVYVNQGDDNGGTGWVLVTEDPIEVGVTELEFVKILVAGGGSGTVDGSGTTDYLPRWTDGDTLADSYLKYDSGLGTISTNGFLIEDENILSIGYYGEGTALQISYDVDDQIVRYAADHFINLAFSSGSAAVITIEYKDTGKIAQFNPYKYGLNGDIDGSTMDVGLFNVGSFYDDGNGVIQIQFSGNEIQAVVQDEGVDPSILKLNPYGGLVSVSGGFAANATHSIVTLTENTSVDVAGVSMLPIDSDGLGTWYLTLTGMVNGQILFIGNVGSQNIIINNVMLSLTLTSAESVIMQYYEPYNVWLYAKTQVALP